MEYNLKSNELLQISDFCCENCLSEDIISMMIQLRKEECLEVYAKSELIEELIGTFAGLTVDDTTIKLGVIDFDSIGFGYDDVYCLSIDDEYMLWCQPAYELNKKTNEYELHDSEATLAYVYQEDVKQDLIDSLEENETPTLLFGFDED